MKNKPSWTFFLSWLVAYTLIDILVDAFLHGHFARTDLPAAIKGAVFGAAVTWFFALFRWYKAQDRF